MKTKIFLLPGFGEDAFVFNELKPYLSAFELIDVEYRNALNKFIFPFITVERFAKELIKEYNIQPNDKLIGHSMGGYFSFQIREIQNNEICMIASFNDPAKVIHMFPNFTRFTQLSIITGLVKLPQVKNNLLSKIKDKRIREVQSHIVDNFDNFTNLQLALMVEMNYAPKIKSNKPNPLRIHNIKDKIVAPPDESYIQIEGGHFSLNLETERVFNTMKSFLNIA
ncbi:MAG: hypothetical protein IPK18_12635 [Sphingobacteriales bacterium]|jgi:surfactin synthase thioesterase subunit|nr:MAG: hypothetical protein IPK18_12635 [Sphingobacteriales bacterium]